MNKGKRTILTARKTWKHIIMIELFGRIRKAKSIEAIPSNVTVLIIYSGTFNQHQKSAESILKQITQSSSKPKAEGRDLGGANLSINLSQEVSN